MKSYLFAFFVSILLFTACKKYTNNAEPAAEVQTISVADTLLLTFNNGHKWGVNAETEQGVKNMDSLIKEFEASGFKNFKTLGDNLFKETGYIIKNCTMTGESHDQLHVVLVPMLDEISILRASQSAAQNQRAFTNLQELIQAYFKHFNL